MFIDLAEDHIWIVQQTVDILAFRALRNTGLALSLGLTAIAAYQGLREAMADQNHPMSRTGTGPATRHLDATGAREVVYCHQCDNEWHRDEHGLTCPRCEGEITEIVSINSILPLIKPVVLRSSNIFKG